MVFLLSRSPYVQAVDHKYQYQLTRDQWPLKHQEFDISNIKEKMAIIITDTKSGRNVLEASSNPPPLLAFFLKP